MKNLPAYLFVLLLLFTTSGCATLSKYFTPVTSAQAIAIAQPVVAGVVQAVLINNPKYIPVCQKVGADMAGQDWGDLTLAGINKGLAAIVAKEGGDATLTAILVASVDAGLGSYLESVSESVLSSDPNAVAVLQALGQALTTGATAAASTPKT